MQEKSKNIFENSTVGTIGFRINQLMKKTGKSVTDLESEGEIGNGTLKTWKDKPLEFSSNVLNSWKSKLQIRAYWWETGEGEIFITPVPEPSGNEEKKIPEEIYRDLVEKNTAYRLVPKTILDEEYRIVLKSELEERSTLWRETLEAKNNLIDQLKQEIATLRASQPISVPAQNAQ